LSGLELLEGPPGAFPGRSYVSRGRTEVSGGLGGRVQVNRCRPVSLARWRVTIVWHVVVSMVDAKSIDRVAEVLVAIGQGVRLTGCRSCCFLSFFSGRQHAPPWARCRVIAPRAIGKPLAAVLQQHGHEEIVVPAGLPALAGDANLLLGRRPLEQR